MKLSKTRYVAGIQCPKMLWLDTHMPTVANDYAAENSPQMDEGSEVGDLASYYFGESVVVPFSLNKDEMLAETRRLLDSGTAVVCEASFADGDNFCSVDILRNFGDYVELVEVKSSTACKDIYLHDMAYQYYVLTRCGVDVRRVSLMYINNAYTRYGALDLRQLFALEDHTDDVRDMLGTIAANIAQISRVAEAAAEPPLEISERCHAPYDCAFTDYCWRNVPQNSVFDVRGLRTIRKWDSYRRGIVTFRDILGANIALNEKQQTQVLWEVEQRPPYIDKPAIREFLATLRYPLYHLDFETYQSAIPEFDGARPYVQIPSQYSLHIEYAPGAQPEHRDFLAEAGTDPRRAIAERLCADIPANVCVLAYNMSFEKGRIRELAELFPNLAPHLLAIHDNVRDLMLPFHDGAYYDRALKGSYSIKYVLPALCPDEAELDYHALDLVHNGGEAMAAFPALCKMPPDEAARYRAALLAYCRLDTLAMVRVLQKLREAAE